MPPQDDHHHPADQNICMEQDPVGYWHIGKCPQQGGQRDKDDGEEKTEREVDESPVEDPHVPEHLEEEDIKDCHDGEREDKNDAVAEDLRDIRDQERQVVGRDMRGKGEVVLHDKRHGERKHAVAQDLEHILRDRSRAALAAVPVPE